MVHHPREPIPRRGAGQAEEPAGERVARALARAGVASRRDAERLIEAGRIALNGEVLTSPAVNVGPDDLLTLDGAPVAEPEAIRVWRYHKPVGLLTTHKDPKGRPTVFDALPKELGRVISVGRLDLNSEGVLLLTNDGGLARALELPANGWVRRYRARAYGRVAQGRLDALKKGVSIEGVDYGPIEAVMEKSGGGSNLWISVAIREGKNREVRRVLEYLGLKVNRLIRTGYGPFELGDLPDGAVAEIPPRMIREKLTAAIEPERMPKGDRRLFNWAPDRDERRTREAAVRRRPQTGASAPGDVEAEAPPQAAAPPPAAGRPEGRQDGPRRAAEAPARAKPSGEGDARAPGRSRHGEAPGKGPRGTFARAAKPGRGHRAAAGAGKPARGPSGKPLSRGDLVDAPRSARRAPGGRGAAEGEASKDKPVYKSGWARPKPKGPPHAKPSGAKSPNAKSPSAKPPGGKRPPKR